MKQVLIASNNKHKLAELRTVLGSYFDKMYSLGDLGIESDPEEVGATFYENALIKARAAAMLAGIPAIADDSGLCVNALKNAPGVLSARYAGVPCDDFKNNELLLKNLKNVIDRRAHFVSCIVLVAPFKNTDKASTRDTKISATGEIYGEILSAPRGDGGFGYDPLFYIPALGKTMAELSPEQKNKISHRAVALNKLKISLADLDVL